jgi:hypothetical protein
MPTMNQANAIVKRTITTVMTVETVEYISAPAPAPAQVIETTAKKLPRKKRTSNAKPPQQQATNKLIVKPLGECWGMGLLNAEDGRKIPVAILYSDLLPRGLVYKCLWISEKENGIWAYHKFGGFTVDKERMTDIKQLNQ